MSEGTSTGAASRFVVGIDLGTTNCALAWVDTTEALAPGASPAIRTFRVPQWTAAGSVEERTLLPSFLYLPAPGEAVPDLPWGSAGAVAGVYAQRRAAEVPDQVVASAKSWLCHAGVDRLASILPWTPPGTVSAEGLERVSPVAASAAYLAHLRDAWNHAHAADDPGARLEEQDVFLTVPASFDAAARELTRLAASEAGLDRIHLLEEPQAALYAWVESSGESWREQVRAGDLVLVCDLGGGTTDLSLVVVEDDGGRLALRRVAVGDHLLLGGD
ncbi:MAG: Hsp70 family protein, partial [Alphaproteobacteria bacterium]